MFPLILEKEREGGEGRRERGREGKERMNHQLKKVALISCLPYTPKLGIKQKPIYVSWRERTSQPFGAQDAPPNQATWPEPFLYIFSSIFPTISTILWYLRYLMEATVNHGC